MQAFVVASRIGLLFLIYQQSYGQTERSALDTVIHFLKITQGYQNPDMQSPLSDGNELSPSDQPQVQTTSGLIYGAKNQYANSFFSIPFAVPPVGDLRFQSPQKLDTPDIIRNLSTRVRNECAQPTGRFNEDCLVLTVNVPASVDLLDSRSPPTEELPVMVFFHGGAYFFGAGTLTTYDGRYLSQTTFSIIVTVNYRLGPLGFLLFDDGEHSIEGNQGQRDQQLALQWVKDNIKNFGGDNSKVTIFGESAGAQSTMLHLVSKISEPLFERAIMQSNPAAYRYPSRQQAQAQTDRLVQSLRCGVLNTDDCCRPGKSSYTCLMEASTGALISGMVRLQLLDITGLNMFDVVEPFRPYIDGVEFSDQPMSLIKEGKWNTKKPFIIGSNQEELVVLKYLLPMDENVFREMNRRLFNEIGNDNKTGDLISDKYIELFGSSISDYSHIFGIEMTDFVFGCSSRALARLASETAESDVFYYIFDHSLDGEDCLNHTIFDNFCGYSHHAAELNFVFRTIAHVGMNPDEEDILVENQFSTYWGNMAWTGNPSEGPGFDLEGEFPSWTRYAEDPEKDAWKNMRIHNPSPYLESSYLEDVCDFWDSLELYEAREADSDTVSTTTPSYVGLLTTSRGIANHISNILLTVALSIVFVSLKICLD